mmetsp:Transcript_46664/g.107837  ORF Transcript_46664/g.107837 Transcript_46664/m.107837 type:complete len:877 (+) Transcript_46664:102-2732(+)
MQTPVRRQRPNGGDDALGQLRKMCAARGGVALTRVACRASRSATVQSTAGQSCGVRDPAGLQELPLLTPGAVSAPGFGAKRSVGPSQGCPAGRCQHEVLVNGSRVSCRLDDHGREVLCDSDGEEEFLCPECRLPMGEGEHVRSGNELLWVHRECKAQLLLLAARKHDEECARKDRLKKNTQREKYDIGWRVDRIPRQSGQSRCGVALDGDSRRVRLVQTSNPATIVNVEYLKLALEVRRSEGREPLFSLDLDYDSLSHGGYDVCWQKKRFEPLWLAGTSLGEVMFQADYHLKELSMGEHVQPVVGMKSCFDTLMSENNANGKEWIAREWFVVKSAKVLVSEDKMVAPVIKMGVEAREQINGPNGIEDARITRPDHPLVRYAETFTHYFDLIAERRGVVRQLCEVAKACLLAKFLLESDVHLDEQLFSMASEVSGGEVEACLEIPQLWNEQRFHQNSPLLSSRTEGGMLDKQHVYGVYGGVEMSLDRIELANLMVSAKKSLVVSATIPSEARVPQGVDLCLDKFSVLHQVQESPEEREGSWDVLHSSGSSFWSAIEEDNEDNGTVCAEEDRRLLRTIFNPHLSDRRDEGDLFQPPCADAHHVRSLRKLISEEEHVQRQRQKHFLSKEFIMSRPGPLFPRSWVTLPRVAADAREHVRSLSATFQEGEGALHERQDYLPQAARLSKCAKLVFDGCTEEGTRFRIYRTGSLELRSTQEIHGEEIPGVVFSRFAALHTQPKCLNAKGMEEEEILKVKQYVEHSGLPARRGMPTWQELLPPPDSRSYIVLETSKGNALVTEVLGDGQVACAVNPPGLEARNSLAKVAREVDTGRAHVTVRRLMSLQNGQVYSPRGTSVRSMRKHYAREIFQHIANDDNDSVL